MDLSVDNCRAYLAARGVPQADRLEVRELGGGVSNRVLLVEGNGARFVLKQSLGRLRVEDDWRADRSRIFREISILREAARFLPAGAVPEVLWADEAAYLFAMAAAEPGAESWKAQLLAGSIDPAVAVTVGVLLGLSIRQSWESAEFEARYGDQTAFDQLRIDPYYRAVARRRPEVRECVEELIAESAGRRVSLVHGDWSPKNFLVGPAGPAGAGSPARVTAIDFEVVHYGDPTFDAAFCINHFLLKCFHRPGDAPALLDLARVFYTWVEGLLPPPALGFFEAATTRHLGCLLLARIDGKSPAEYITGGAVKEAVRRTAVRIIQERPGRLETCYAWVQENADPFR